jgi:hypothetical protein
MFREKSFWFLVFKESFFLPSFLFWFFHIASVIFKELSLVPDAVNKTRTLSSLMFQLQFDTITERICWLPNGVLE